jgi:ribosomal protein S1
VVDPRSFGKVGDLIKVKVYAVTDTGFYASLRDTERGGDPYAQESEYSIGTRHDAFIETVKPFGAFARLSTGALGLVRNAASVLAPGDRLRVEVVSFDRKLKKLELRPVEEGEG